MLAHPVLLQPTGHSATVRMWLHGPDGSFPLVQACDTAVRLRDDADVPAGPAVLEISVDGQSSKTAVTVLAHGEARWLAIGT